MVRLVYQFSLSAKKKTNNELILLCIVCATEPYCCIKGIYFHYCYSEQGVEKLNRMLKENTESDRTC